MTRIITKDEHPAFQKSVEALTNPVGSALRSLNDDLQGPDRVPITQFPPRPVTPKTYYGQYLEWCSEQDKARVAKASEEMLAREAERKAERERRFVPCTSKEKFVANAEGVIARLTGAMFSSNPYPRDTEKFESWRSGFTNTDCAVWEEQWDDEDIARALSDAYEWLEEDE